MPKDRLNFTKVNDKTGKIENVGYLDLENNDDTATLYFYGDIVSTEWDKWSYDDKCPQDIADFLNTIEKGKNIDVYFNSAGGSVFAGIAIYNQLKRHEGHKTGYVDGIAASIASVIMFACDDLIFSTGSQCMIHKPLCLAYGNADDLMETVEILDKAEERILDIYEAHAKEGISREQIKEKVDAETWFCGEEIAEFFDVTVEERPEIAACASDFYGRYTNIPDKVKKDSFQAAAAIAEAKKNEIESAKQELLADLDMYGF